MDRFKVSGMDLQNYYEGQTTLATVFSDIERDLKAENKVVCQFIVNGLELHEQDEVRFSNMKLADVQSLEYLSENTSELIQGVLESWIKALPELMQNTEKLSARIRYDGVQNTFKSIHDLMENIEFLISSIVSLKTILGDKVATELIDWSQAESMTRKTMDEALLATEKKDFVLLADIMEYDINNCLQNWLEILQALESSLSGNRTVTSKKESTGIVARARLAN